MHIFLAVLLGLILAPDAAHAGPVFMAALSAGASVGSAFAATTLGSFLTTTVIGKLLTSVAMSALAQALQSKPSSQPPGIKTTTTQAGGTNPGQFILGRYATGGYAAAPAMSHGDVGRTPNAYLTYVIEVSDLPVTGLDGIIIDGIPCTLGATPHADYGLPVQGDFLDRAWVKFYTGTQTAADPMLLAKYGSYPERPWTADMVGTGIAYAIVTFQYDREVFDSLPAVRFVVDGLKLYDPRKDSTVGGSGTHRWSNPATWAFTNNPVVMIYNIMRGITLPDGSIWGGNFAAADLPLVNWFAAMNVCDAPVTEGGETVARFRAGLEVSVGDEPAQVIEELLKACSGQIVDMGGTWKIRAGGPGLPVLFVTDEDVIATRPEDFDPFPGLSETYNGITATYPEPKALWEAKEAAPIYNSAWEAEDGGRRLVANLQFAAVTSHRQARNLMRSTIKDHRRMRRHNLALAPFAMGLEPLDVVAWTSSRNGYAAKAFELGQVVDDLGAGVPLPQIAIREVDPSDFDPNLLDDAPLSLPPGRVVRPAAQTVPGFAVEAVTLQDAGGADRRPALRLTWTADGLADVEAIEWEVRRTGTTALVNDGSTTNVASGKRTISAGILPATAYQVRARFVVGRARAWTAWVGVTSPDARLTVEDLDDSAAPPVPTGLALTSALSGSKVTLAATWTAVAGSRMRYEVRIRQGAGADVVFMTTTTRYEWDVLPNTAYTVAVRAVNRLGVQSAYSGEVTHTSTRDTTPPALPTGLTVTAGFETLWLKWARNTEADLAGYEVFESTTATPAPVAGTAATYATAADTLVITALPDAVTRHYWLRAVDTSGNKSAWTARVQGTTLALVDADISGILQSASYAAGLVPPLVVSSLPTSGNFAGRLVVLTTDGKLYRHTGSPAGAAGYTAAVPAADVTGQLTNAQIADLEAAKLTGQITASQIADTAITATKFASGLRPVEIVAILPATGNFAGRTAFLTTDNKLYRHTGTVWTAAVPSADLTGEITSTQIADSAVSTPKLAANAVVADKIAANAITAGKIAADAVTAGKIAAGAVNAREIAAGAVTARSLTVGDFTNLAGHSNMTDETYFSSSAGTSYVDGDTTWNSDRLLRLAGDGASFVIAAGRTFEVTPGARFYLAYKAQIAAGTGNCYIDLQLSASTTMSSPLYRTLGTVTSMSVTQMSGALGVVPAGYKYARLRVIKSNNGTTECLFGDLVLRRMNEGELIVDGAVIADKIAADAVTTAKIAASAVVADKIAANAVTAVKIEANAVTTDKLAANAVTAAKIAANTITAAEITAGAIGADQIAAGAIVTSKLAVGDFTNLVPDPNFSEFGSTWTGGAGTGSIIDAPTTDWAYPRVLRVVSPTASIRTFLSQPFDVRAGDPLWFWMQAQMVSGTGAITGIVQFSETANFAVVLANSTTVSISSTTVTAQSLKITAVPALARYARIRFAFPTTGSEGLIGRAVVRRAMNGEVIIDGSITADSVGTNEIIASAANIKDAVITSAKINDLSAAKLTAGTALAGSITVSGTALSTIQGQAADPAAVVNAGATKINPGQITVSGATTLADWRRGGDETKIDGGAVSANTISANKLTIGNRMLTLTGIQFEHNAPATNQVSWTAGNVRWANDAGGTTNTAIAAGSATWTSGILYIYWVKGATSLSTTTAIGTAFGADNVVLATYAGGKNMTTDYGQTIIDGSNIKTGTLTANKVDTTDFNAAGVSIFGNDLKSSNYVTGTSGWRLSHNGTLEIQNLIQRAAIVDGAVSDKTQSVLLGPRDFTTTANEVLLTHSVGAVAFGSILKRGIVFEARNVSSNRQVTLVFQIRRKYAGVWDAWEQLTSWVLGSSNSAWGLYTSSATLAGAYDDVEYRLLATTAAPDTFSGIRNLYITTVNVVK